MEILVNFGKKVRSLREKKGMTQEDLAFKSKLSVYYISKLERGKANPSLVTLNSIARALGVSAKEVLP